MPDLVTVDQLKGELRIQGTTHEDDELERKLNEAEDLCLDYVNQRLGDTASAWSDTIADWRDGTTTAPTQVVAAILDMAVMLYRFRGDDVDLPSWWNDGRMPPSVRMKLDRLRDVTIA